MIFFEGTEPLSLSRLNHGQPRVQAHPEIVQGTAQFHHEITDASLPQLAPVFDNAAALDTTIDMLDPQPPLVEYLVGPLLLQGQLRTAGLLRRHEDFDLREREGQEAQILQQPTPGWKWAGGGLRDAQIMDTATVGVTQKEDDEQGIDEQDVLERVIFFLPAITLEFIPIKPLAATDASARGSCAGHNRVPSPDRGRPPSTAGSGLSQCDNASHCC